MKLYLQNDTKLFKFKLSNKIDGSFVFEFKLTNNPTTNFINVDAINNEWILKANGSVNIIEDGRKVETKLFEYKNVILETNSGIRLLLTCVPTNDIEYSTYSLTNLNQLTIGKLTTNNIVFPLQQSENNPITIIKNDSKWMISLDNNANNNVYVNDRLLKKPLELKTGDIIFSTGLKIIWMHNFFKINNPNSTLSINGLFPYQENLTSILDYTDLTEEEKCIELYKEDEYFSHTPRIKTVLEIETVNIDAPPENQNKEDELPFFLSIGTSFTMFGTAFMTTFNIYNSVGSGKKDIREFIPNIVMVVAMILGAIIIPRLIKRYTKKKRIQRENLRQQKYGDYLNKKETQINNIILNQKQILHENNLSIEDCKKIIEQKSINLWNRKLTDIDFLNIRLGIGTYPAQLTINAPEEKFSLDEDDLQNKVYDLHDKYKYLKDVPIVQNLITDNIIAMILDSSNNDDYLNGILLQLITYYSANDLKLVILTDETKKDKWEYTKYLPHIFSEDKQTRLYASNLDELKLVNQYLDSVYNSRNVQEEGENSNVDYKNFSGYYLIITDNFKNIRTASIIDKILNSKNNTGFSLLILDDKLKNLPKECTKFIYICDTESGVFDNELKNQGTSKFVIEYNKNLDMRSLANKLLNIPIKSKEIESELPDSISFLDMYNVGKIEQLNVLNRWENNDSTSSLNAIVGVHKNGDLFKLDLHEKADGPHGLIAGSTGSGKSEFIITYILSMSINYHPDDFQFVLIDYKGGGLAGAFENRETGLEIPHLAGTITNLDVSEMNRTLVSIESELKRRQIMFNQAREKLGESTMDIYKYQKLYHQKKLDVAISHLFIISDEFAELKSQQPEFMSQLISTARIGRSLGVHLILATQKPSGVVNDQIWSNSKFKVCLKVQSRADSMEMLKRPEAASLKQAGRFYLQVGYDEYFDIGQSGWAGARYLPTERIIKKVDESLCFIDNTGQIIKKIEEDKKIKVEDDNGDQLTNIVKYLANIGIRENINKSKLWLPALKKEMYLDELINKYNINLSLNINQIHAIIGEFDNPRAQKQGVITLNLSKLNNTLIYGVSGSGKDNLLATIIMTTAINYSPESINFYVCDFGAETLKTYQKLPHVGDVIISTEHNKLESLLQLLNKEIERRKKLFVDYNGNYTDYCQYSGKKELLLVIIVNSFENFVETYPKMQDAFDNFIRDGSKYGIIFILTTSIASSIRMKLSQNFANKICLKMPNTTDYRDILSAPRGLVPVDNFGRGIFRIDDVCLEFQTLLLTDKENMLNYVKEKINLLSQKYKYKAKKIPVLPDIVYKDDVLFELKGLDCVPIGIEKNSLEVYVYDFMMNKVNVISSIFVNNHIYFIYGLISQMINIKDVSINVVDLTATFNMNYENVKVFNSNYEEFIVQAYNNIDKLKDKKEVYFILGIGKLKERLSEPFKEYYDKLFNNLKSYEDTYFILVDDYVEIKKLQLTEWYRNSVDNSYGIWLGEDVGNQMALNVMTLGVEDKKILFPCIAFPVYKGSHMIIKYVVDGVEKKDEE